MPCRASHKLALALFYEFLKLGNESAIFYDFSYFEKHESEAYGLLYGNENHLRV